MSQVKPYLHSEALARSREHRWTLALALSGAALLCIGMWVGWTVRTGDCNRAWDVHEMEYHR